MADTIKQKVNWTNPTITEPKYGADWGTYEPPTLMEVDPPGEGEHPSGVMASQLMTEVYSKFTKGDLAPWRWITAPDMGPQTDSFSRPDLIPLLVQLRDGIQLLEDALYDGPRRTIWDPEIEVWRIITPSAKQEAEYRKAQKGSK